jgi:hypothetical protein
VDRGLCEVVDFAVGSLHDRAAGWRQDRLVWLVGRQVVSGRLVGLIAGALIVRLLEAGRDGLEGLVAQEQSLAEGLRRLDGRGRM